MLNRENLVRHKEQLGSSHSGLPWAFNDLLDSALLEGFIKKKKSDND